MCYREQRRKKERGRNGRRPVADHRCVAVFPSLSFSLSPDGEEKKDHDGEQAAEKKDDNDAKQAADKTKDDNDGEHRVQKDPLPPQYRVISNQSPGKHVCCWWKVQRVVAKCFIHVSYMFHTFFIPALPISNLSWQNFFEAALCRAM